MLLHSEPPVISASGVPYWLTRKLGSGSTAFVWEVRKENGERKALKIHHDDRMGVPEHEGICRAGTHPNLISTDELWFVNGRLHIIMELAEQTLFDWAQQFACEMPIGVVMPWLEQVFAGLDSLHRRGISHGDVIAKNVMIVGGMAKLGDFTLCGCFPISRDTEFFARMYSNLRAGCAKLYDFLMVHDFMSVEEGLVVKSLFSGAMNVAEFIEAVRSLSGGYYERCDFAGRRDS